MKKHLEIVLLGVDELTPYKNNAKQHPREQIEEIKQSIIDNGFNDPIAVWGENNLIVEGHGRWIACKELGRKKIECIRLDHLTEEQRRAYTLTHNKLTMNSGFDNEILTLELEELQDLGIDVIGFEELDEINETYQPANNTNFNTDITDGESVPVSFIDTLLQDDDCMKQIGKSDIERDTFNITFTFPKEYEEIAKQYITDNGKDGIVKLILEEMGAM